MKYVIYRTQKLKAAVSIRRSLKHAFREQETPNADSGKQHLNEHIGAHSANDAMMKVRKRWPEKRRKDAVLAIEHLVTASPEWFKGKSRKEQNMFFKDALNWIKDKFGHDNVIYAGVHRDETSPHMYVYSVPLDESTGRLNCKKWLGGPKAMVQLQDEIGELGKNFGLKRGKRKSKARHKKISTWYAEQIVAETRAKNAKKLELSASDRLSLAMGKTPKVVEEFNQQVKAFKIVYQNMKNKLSGAESARVRCEMAASKLVKTELERSSVIRKSKRKDEEHRRQQEALEKRLSGAMMKESELSEKVHQLASEKEKFELENAALIAELNSFKHSNNAFKI